MSAETTDTYRVSQYHASVNSCSDIGSQPMHPIHPHVFEEPPVFVILFSQIFIRRTKIVTHNEHEMLNVNSWLNSEKGLNTLGSQNFYIQYGSLSQNMVMTNWHFWFRFVFSLFLSHSLSQQTIHFLKANRETVCFRLNVLRVRFKFELERERERERNILELNHQNNVPSLSTSALLRFVHHGEVLHFTGLWLTGTMDSLNLSCKRCPFWSENSRDQSKIESFFYRGRCG